MRAQAHTWNWGLVTLKLISRRLGWVVVVLVGTVLLGVAAYLALLVYSSGRSNSLTPIERWFTDSTARPALTTRQRTPCPGAPFLLPSDGLIGLLWSDPALPYTDAVGECCLTPP
jgi:hypothetical protein